MCVGFTRSSWAHPMCSVQYHCKIADKQQVRQHKCKRHACTAKTASTGGQGLQAHLPCFRVALRHLALANQDIPPTHCRGRSRLFGHIQHAATKSHSVAQAGCRRALSFDQAGPSQKERVHTLHRTDMEVGPLRACSLAVSCRGRNQGSMALRRRRTGSL